MSKRKAYIYSYIISLFYVGWATIAVLSLYPDDVFFGDWAAYSMILTFPAAILSFVYRFTTPDSYWPVILIQLLSLLAFGPIIYWLFFRKNIRQDDESSQQRL